MQLIFEQIAVGGDKNLSYLVGDREVKEAFIVDPSYNPGYVVRRAQAQGLAVKLIVNTHGHFDHVEGNRKAKALTGASIAAYHTATHFYDTPLHEGDTISSGKYTFSITHVPGHAQDHIVLYCQEIKAAITGDLLFVGKVGITRSVDDSTTEYHSIQKVLQMLPDETTIWPGHDYNCRPCSSIAMEKESNAFLQVKSLEEFLLLKENWQKIRVREGIL